MSAAFVIALFATPVEAAEVIGVFDNQGNCNAAWNELNNTMRKDMRQSGNGVNQKDLTAMGVYYCTASGNVWLLVKA